MKAKVGEIWQDTNGVCWIVAGQDTASDTTKTDAGFESSDLENKGWTRLSQSSTEIGQLLADLTSTVEELRLQCTSLKSRIDAALIP